MTINDNMNGFNEIKKQISNEYSNVFNDSIITFSNAFFGNDTIFVSMYLGKNNNEFINGINDNDLINALFQIKIIDNNTYLLEKVRYSIKIKTTNKYLYCEHKQLTFRKVKGTQDKIIESFKKIINNLYNSILSEYNNNNLLDYDMELFKTKYIKKV